MTENRNNKTKHFPCTTFFVALLSWAMTRKKIQSCWNLFLCAKQITHFPWRKKKASAREIMMVMSLARHRVTKSHLSEHRLKFSRLPRTHTEASCFSVCASALEFIWTSTVNYYFSVAWQRRRRQVNALTYPLHCSHANDFNILWLVRGCDDVTKVLDLRMPCFDLSLCLIITSMDMKQQKWDKD